MARRRGRALSDGRHAPISTTDCASGAIAPLAFRWEGGVYKLDLTNAKCTLIASGGYPSSLSFVPAGTLAPNVEALVGYYGSTYIRIDTTSGQVTTIGGLTGGYSSSGDIVSVKNGGTFLTVNGNVGQRQAHDDEHPDDGRPQFLGRGLDDLGASDRRGRRRHPHHRLRLHGSRK